MQVRVVYTSEGAIVSLMRSGAPPATGSGGAPLITAEPSEGQRVALVALDPAWQDRALAEIHEAFRVAEGPDGPCLRPRSAGA